MLAKKAVSLDNRLKLFLCGPANELLFPLGVRKLACQVHGQQHGHDKHDKCANSDPQEGAAGGRKGEGWKVVVMGARKRKGQK